MSKVKIPNYSLAEELINSISHGVGGVLAVIGMILMLIKADTPIEYITLSIFGTSMILLYVISCIYHALSPRIKGKKVLRVLDHCNVFLLVLGTYIPATLLGVRGTLGWILFSLVLTITIVGVVLSAIAMDKLQVFEVICHLINGWSILFGIKYLIQNMGIYGVILFLIGGIMYTVGSILYGIGSQKKYFHSIFHFFCLLGTLFHFLGIYLFLI